MMDKKTAPWSIGPERAVFAVWTLDGRGWMFFLSDWGKNLLDGVVFPEVSSLHGFYTAC
ncbi:hypothetical protein [Desulfobotulus alkaliphilus]|uniref:hypothetical protein n=1 Tax=Desulfobotulus alkaliphilus TaxID=622671 RepID=UPI0016494A0D|nr:hypothetical protein [Desulfobotulus alkaliphilus]